MLIVYLLIVFVLGAVIGSFLNVCIVRMPLEKSLLWPGSHCGNCYKPVAWYDNIPLVSYWLLGGKCRSCGTTFSVRYFLVELFTAIGFVLLFWWTVVENVNHLPGLGLPAVLLLGDVPVDGWIAFAHRALLFSLLMVASCCDLSGLEIPLSVTLPGTLFGLIFSTLFPWPWPYVGPIPPFRPGIGVPGLGPFDPPLPGGQQGIMPWPAWWPLAAFLPPGAWYTGLASSVAGALAGTFLLRSIRFIFSTALGKEALGLGDADLMMMAGSFVGWPVVVVAFFLAVFPALLLGILQIIFAGNRTHPFGPSLALSIMGTLLIWYSVGPFVEPILFGGTLMVFLILIFGAFMVLMGLALRLSRWLRTKKAPA